MQKMVGLAGVAESLETSGMSLLAGGGMVAVAPQRSQVAEDWTIRNPGGASATSGGLVLTLPTPRRGRGEEISRDRVGCGCVCVSVQSG